MLRLSNYFIESASIKALVLYHICLQGSHTYFIQVEEDDFGA